MLNYIHIYNWFWILLSGFNISIKTLFQPLENHYTLIPYLFEKIFEN